MGSFIVLFSLWRGNLPYSVISLAYPAKAALACHFDAARVAIWDNSRARLAKGQFGWGSTVQFGRSLGLDESCSISPAGG